MFESKGENGGGDDSSKHVVKLRGLPFSTTVEDVLEFLNGVDVVGGASGVTLTETRPGRPSGECFVELADSEQMQRALAKDKQHIGKRYIEVFASDAQELAWGRGAGRGAIGADGLSGEALPDDAPVVKLRGLPFGCSTDDVVNFLDGLAVAEDGVQLLTDRAGRSTGEAFVRLLDPEDAAGALHKDREKIGHRYIEVFASSADEVRAWHARDGDGAGGGGGGRVLSARSFPRHAPYERPQRFPRSDRVYRNNDIL